MNNLQCRKAYVRVNLDVDEEGTIIPMLIRWKDGRVFQIEQLKYKCRASSNKVGGGGIRYTVIIRGKRVEANLTQAALAEKVSVTARTIQNYELGSRKPTKYEVVKKIAEALNTTPEYLLGNSGMLVLAAQEQGGAKAAREIDELVSEVSGMFAGGSLSEDALDGAMQALTRAYWIAKEKNKKYTPKKYRKEQTEE